MKRSSLLYGLLVVAGILALSSSVKTKGSTSVRNSPSPLVTNQSSEAVLSNPVQFSPSPKVPVVTTPSSDPTPSPSPIASPSSIAASPAAQASSATTRSAVGATSSPVAPPSAASNEASTETYTNKDGNQVQRPTFSDSVPAGATARCKDGSYSFSQNRRGTCSGHSGVATWLYLGGD